MDWPFPRIRNAFFSHFEFHQYNQLSSSPLIEVDDSTPPIDTYLNQFIHEVDESLQIRSRKSSCYSLRCLNIRGVDDSTLIHRFNQSSSYYTFSEKLGSWASGGYKYKEEAIKLSWDLLTKTYKIPQSKIYIKYFAGNTESHLDPDDESLSMWKKYLPKERILPSTDFWRAGDVGPCGPSIGILFDISDSKENIADINDKRLVEVWHLVFVQFDMQKNGVLKPLHITHVITVMEAERLAYILQKKRSIYVSDVYSFILQAVQFGACDRIGQYSDKIGNADCGKIDTAYRLVANHLRMISAVTDYCAQRGLQTKDREDLLKDADRRAAVFGHKVLNTKSDKYGIVLNSALRMSGFYFAQMEAAKIESILEDELEIYKKMRAKEIYKKMQAKVDQGLLDCNPSTTNSNLHPSLPPKKKEKKKNKHQKEKKQEKRPAQLPPTSVN